MFYPEQRGGALGIAQILPMTGLSWGPLIGSAALSNGRSWRWILWITSMVVGGLEIFSMITTPETHNATLQQRRKPNQPMPKRPNFKLVMVLRAFKIWAFYPVALVIAVHYATLWGFGYIVFTTLTEVFESHYGILPKDSGLYCLGWGRCIHIRE
jgi:MFS family permease